jgi:alcohol dehydrogenase, propanol-preferring
MRAMVLKRTTLLSETDAPLELIELPIPQPQAGEVRVKVAACGVCHTELDEIEGRTPPPVLPIVLGHEIVGHVDALGKRVTRLKEGQRVGVGWIHSSSGEIDENISPQFRATGRDVNGGYAEYMTVPENYAYPMPPGFSDAEAAPLLCAGAVGYRALQLTGMDDGQPLGFMGFGGSAHLVLQAARHQFPHSPISVFARDEIARQFALQLGAVWAGDISDRAPELLYAIIDTTPAWRPIVEALANLRSGGRLVINAIRKEDGDKNCLQFLDYEKHLWMEREIKTVANVTHHDIQRFLPLAAEIPIKPEVITYRLEDANRALVELKSGRVKGAKVLLIK